MKLLNDLNQVIAGLESKAFLRVILATSRYSVDIEVRPKVTVFQCGNMERTFRFPRILHERNVF